MAVAKSKAMAGSMAHYIEHGALQGVWSIICSIAMAGSIAHYMEHGHGKKDGMARGEMGVLQEEEDDFLILWMGQLFMKLDY